MNRGSMMESGHVNNTFQAVTHFETSLKKFALRNEVGPQIGIQDFVVTDLHRSLFSYF